MMFLQIDTVAISKEVALFYEAGGGSILGLLLFSLAITAPGLTGAVVAQWYTGNRRAE